MATGMKSVQVISAARSLAASGRLPEAERVLRHALAGEPGSWAMLQELGAVLRSAGRAREAADALTQAARLRPDSAPLLLELSRALAESSQLAPAVSAAERATRVSPGDGGAWRELGKRLHALGRVGEAGSALSKAAGLLPGDAEVRRLLAEGLHAVGRNAEGLEHARRAATLRRGAPELVTLALILLARGHGEEALAAFDEAMRLAPESPEAICGKARAAEAMGNKALALETLGRAVRGPSCTNAMLAQYAALCVSSPDRGAVIDLCRARLRDFGGNPASTLQLWMSLGSLLEAEGDYAGAFDAYRRGKSCYPQTFRGEEHTARVREIIGVFGRSDMGGLACSACDDARAVIIVGMPRSGTTLLEQIIAGHPRAAGVGERDEMLVMLDGLSRRLGVQTSFPRSFLSATPEVLDAMAREYLSMLDRLAPGRERVVDKMPHNFLGLGAIARVLPRATLVHSRRHPLDTCFSCFATALTTAHDYSTSLSNLVVAYRAYRELMAHWGSVLGDRLVEMEYEKLVAEPEAESRRLIGAVGLAWDPSCLKFHEGKRAVVTASASQVRRPMYDSSIGRWRRFEPYLSELIEGLRDYL